MLQALELVQGANDFGMIVGIAESLECDERVQHRGENGGESVATLKTFEHPSLGFFQRAFAERAKAVLLDKLKQLIEPKKKVAPGESVRVGRWREIALVIAGWIKLVQIDVNFSSRFEVIDDGQRNEHRPRPIAHLVEVYVKPFADENDFARNRGHVVPGKEAQQREIQFRKGIQTRHAAEVLGHFARAEHSWIGHGHAR